MSGFTEWSWDWNPSCGVPCFLSSRGLASSPEPALHARLIYQTACPMSSLTCLIGISSFTVQTPNLHCQTCLSRVFPVSLNSTLCRSCRSRQNPRSHPCSLFFSPRPSYPARSIQDPTTSHHFRCRHADPSHHGQCPVIATASSEVFPFLHLLLSLIYSQQSSQRTLLQWSPFY